MQENKNSRYDKQLVLPNFGQAGQDKLAKSRILVVGAGGLGLPILMYLAAAGVGRITIIDGDRVAASNLNRQILYNPTNIGEYKAEVARAFLAAQNPMIAIKAELAFLTNQNALGLISEVDLVLDASDNLATRYIIDDACRLLDKSWVFGAVFRYQGQVAVFNSLHFSAEERCIYRDWQARPAAAGMDCGEAGILGAATGIIGSMQAMAAIKYLAEIGDNTGQKLSIYDTLAQNMYSVDLLPNRADYIDIMPRNSAEFLAFDYLLHCKNSVENTKKPLYQSLDKAVLGEWQASGRDFCLIDLRGGDSEEDFEDFRVWRLPFERYYSGMALPQAADLVFYCARGRRAAFVAADVARQADLSANIWVLAAGIGTQL